MKFACPQIHTQKYASPTPRQRRRIKFRGDEAGFPFWCHSLETTRISGALSSLSIRSACDKRERRVLRSAQQGLCEVADISKQWVRDVD